MRFLLVFPTMKILLLFVYGFAASMHAIYSAVAQAGDNDGIFGIRRPHFRNAPPDARLHASSASAALKRPELIKEKSLRILETKFKVVITKTLPAGWEIQMKEIPHKMYIALYFIIIISSCRYVGTMKNLFYANCRFVLHKLFKTFCCKVFSQRYGSPGSFVLMLVYSKNASNEQSVSCNIGFGSGSREFYKKDERAN